VSRRLVIITEIISPYRIPLFNALASRPEVDLHVIFLAETDPALRQWQVYKEEIRFAYEVLPSWRARVGRYNALLNAGIRRALRVAAPDVVLCGGYNYLASWQALQWARARRVPFLLWSESNVQDMRARHAAVEFLKQEFIRRCNGFVVPGKSAFEYLRSHGVPEQRIFTAVNAVDNDFFCREAARARECASHVRVELGLPSRYFLFVGRLVPEKGVFELLSAYATLEPEVRHGIGLVFVGDGKSRSALEKASAQISPGHVRFAGFAQREDLAKYYALADVVMLPTYTDTWGLVVNEAMACRVPVVVSDIAGCAADLIVSDHDGQIVPPKDVGALVRSMRDVADFPEKWARMAQNGWMRIAEYSPVQWSEGISEAVNMVGASRG
jgi:glycosyltransferase involved in cell wall biosynthesis